MLSKTPSARSLNGLGWLLVGPADVGGVHLGIHMAICQDHSTLRGWRERAKRTAETEIRIGRVELLPPKGRLGVAPLAVWLVRVLEPPPRETGLGWLLLSRGGCAGGVGHAARGIECRSFRQSKLRSPPCFLSRSWLSREHDFCVTPKKVRGYWSVLWEYIVRISSDSSAMR